MLTQVRLKQIYTYNPDTGEFIRCGEPNNRMKLGTVANKAGPNGTPVIALDGNMIAAHRAAWLYMTGVYPSKDRVVHLDGDRQNCVWANLADRDDVNNADLTYERLDSLVRYNPNTGRFTAKVARNGVSVGSELGSVREDGYVLITIDRKRYLAHRLAWLYMEEEWPQRFIDHRDGNPSNNRWKNLREADDSTNQMNQKSSSESGFKGVYRNGNGWRAEICKDGDVTRLGTYSTAELAAKAYDKAAKKLHGAFARLNFPTAID